MNGLPLNKVRMYPHLLPAMANDIANRAHKMETSTGIEMELDWKKAKLLDAACKAKGLPPITRLEDL